MSNKSHIFGYLLGLLIFVIGIPALMWLASGRPWPYVPDSAVLCTVSLILAICGLTLSIYSIVYMRIVGKGNPFDAYGHELAPRTKHLMTSGPYRLCRNPMLIGIYIYDAGVLVWLWSALPLLIVLAEVILLTQQVRSEEKRLEKDFGQEAVDTLLKRMEDSGYVSMYREGRVFYYHAEVTAKAYCGTEVVDFCKTWFDGDPVAMMEAYMKKKKLTPNQKRRMKDAIS